MQQRRIGNTEITTSVIGLGTWAVGGDPLWGKGDDEQSIRAIREAVDSGVRWVDTAPVYGFGHSEEIVGKALKGCRDQVLISTKGGLAWDEDWGTYHTARLGLTVRRNLRADSLRRQVEQSLRRLQTDYIDLYYTHWQSIEPCLTPIAETMGALMELKKEGKIRMIGASNVTVEQLEEYRKYGPIDAIQEKYNLLFRGVEEALLPYCERHGITLQSYASLEQGLLTGKVDASFVAQEGSIRAKGIYWKPENLREVVEMFRQLEALPGKYGCSMGNLIIAWTAARSERINVLCGARKPGHARENAVAGGIHLDEWDIRLITDCADRLIRRVNK